jgi:glycosyltransferase involved in cell wall biosynthesis
MNKKKVYVDLFYLNTALTGIKTYMLEFCEAVKENPSEKFEYHFSHDPVTQSTTTFFRGSVPFWRKAWYHIFYFIWKQLMLPIKVISSGADVLICFDFIAPAWPLGIKKIVVVHDAFFWQMPQNYNAHWRKYFIKMMYAGLRGNRIVVTTSAYSKKSILQITAIKEPVEVIYQCPRLLSGSADDSVLDRFQLKKHGFFLHVGSFDKRKFIPVLIKAFSVFDHKYPGKYQLVLVGERGLSVDLDDYDAIITEINTQGLAGKVTLTGFLQDAEVKSLYAHAFAYIFPSSNEGFGIPIIEAMKSNLPIIISDQEALLEIAGGAALVHRTGSWEELAEKMDQLINDQELRTRLIEEGKKRSHLFNRSAFINNFETLMVY